MSEKQHPSETEHRIAIKLGHRSFGTVLSNDDGDDEGGASGITPGSCLDKGGLAHPYIDGKQSSYFSSTAGTKLSANATDNAAVSEEQFPNPALAPGLQNQKQHTKQATKTNTPRLTLS